MGSRFRNLADQVMAKGVHLLTALTAFLRMRQAVNDAVIHDQRIVGLVSDGSFIKDTVGE